MSLISLEKCETVPSWQVGRLGPMSWPPQSDNLVPVDRFLRAYVKDNVYFPYLPAGIDNLKARISCCCYAMRVTLHDGTNLLWVGYYSKLFQRLKIKTGFKFTLNFFIQIQTFSQVMSYFSAPKCVFKFLRHTCELYFPCICVYILFANVSDNFTYTKHLPIPSYALPPTLFVFVGTFREL